MSSSSVVTRTRTRVGGRVQIALGAMLWGTAGVAGRLASEAGSTPLATAGARTVVAALVLAPLAGAARTRPLPWRPRTRLAIVAGGALLAIYQTAYFAAVDHAGVTVATLIALGVAPVVVAIASPLAGDARPGARTWAVIVVAVGGLTLLVLGGADAAPAGGAPPLGAALALICALGFAGVSLLGRTLQGVAPLHLLAIAFSVAGLLQAAPLIGRLPDVTVDGVVALVYLGTVPTALAYVLFFRGIAVVRAAVATVTTLLEPVTAAVLAAAVFGERLAPIAWVGAGLVIIAMVLLGVVGAGEPVAEVVATSAEVDPRDGWPMPADPTYPRGHEF
jgi:DME family drug/metabolite transporter